jgi:hypothetical protein
MSDIKSTDGIRLIAQDAIRQQEQVCQARRDNLADKLTTLAEAVSANATSIAALTQTVAVLATTVQATAKTADANETDIDVLKTSVTKLKGRPAIWALIGSAIGSGVPIAVGLLLWWMSNR